ncbi:MAG: aminotransferase class I/II-fold pyridoxal phosphate-dependent enzyme, partial [Beijerinckiaceae bacterium]
MRELGREDGAYAAPVASARSAVDPFIVMDVMRAAADLEAQGRHIVHMEVGQPGHPAPKPALAAAAAAIAAGRVPYTEALGMRSLRARIASWYRERHGVAVSPERVVVTTGSSGGFTLAFLAMFAPGDRVAIARPGYPAYRNILKALSLEPVEIATPESSRFALSADLIRETHAKTPLAGVLAMSPANPTGVVMTPETLRHL